MSAATIDRARGRNLSPGDLPQVQRVTFDAIVRRDLIDATRRAMPNADAVTGLRAVRTLAALRNDPFYRDAVTAHLARAADGCDFAPGAVPEPFTARVHASKPRRTRKGRATFTVTRGYDATVAGDVAHVTRPYDLDNTLSDIDRGYLTAHLSTIPRKSGGRSALGVLRVTDYRLSAYGVPRLLGSEIPGRKHGNAWATIIPGDRSSQCSVALQRTDLLGGLAPTHLAHFAQQKDVYASHTPHKSRVARFAISRLRLRTLKARKTDPSTVSTEQVGKDGKTRIVARFVPTVDPPRLATVNDPPRTDGLGYERCLMRTTRYVMPADRLALRWTDDAGREHLATAPPETLWLGHQLTPRGQTDRDRRATATQANEQRTIGTVPAPSSEIGWRELADALNRGECVKVTYPDGLKRTVSRAPSGDYATTLPDGARVKARSSEALALRLA